MFQQLFSHDVHRQKRSLKSILQNKKTNNKQRNGVSWGKNYCVLQEKRDLLCSSVSIEFKYFYHFKKIQVKLILLACFQG